MKTQIELFNDPVLNETDCINAGLEIKKKRFVANLRLVMKIWSQL